MKYLVGLGNPDSRHAETRHNVGWWVVDRAAYEWGFGFFRRSGPAWWSEGEVAGEPVALVKPATYMNRSGSVIPALRQDETFDPAKQLLVIVDDAALDVGKVRLRPRGSPGGHNGLRSIAGALGTDEYPRLRVGVGRPPEGWDLVQWVLSRMDEDDEDRILALLPELVEAIEMWIEHGTEYAMSRHNR